MKKGWKAGTSLCLALLLGGTMAACTGDPGTPNKPTPGDTTKTQNVRIFTYSGQEFDSVTMDTVMQEIEKKVNVKLSFEGATEEDYYTKLSPMMNSGDWPDIIWSDPENSGGAFQTWADPKQELLYNLDELIIGNEDRYPYLDKLINSKQYKNIKYYDGHYIVPMVQTMTAWAIYYRADWLEQIGFVDENGKAKAPETLAEFEYVMSRFSGTDLFTDANGNKSGKTWGISPNTRNFYVNPLYGAFGITPDWDISESGEVSYMYAREEFKPYLEWMHAMYEKGYIDNTFNQNKGFDDRQDWYDGKVGCIMTNGEGHFEYVVKNFENSQGAGKIIVGPPPVGTGEVSELTGCKLGVAGERGYSNWGGMYGGYAITQGTKDPYRCLDLLEYLISPEGSMLRLYGIEGKHYNLDADGNVVVDIDGRNSERINYFDTVTNADDTKSSGGLHKMGGRFGYAVDWEYFDQTGEIKIATDIAALFPKYSTLMREALGYTQYLQTSKLTNFTAYPSSINTYRSEVMNISETLINRVITGSVDLNSGWTQMLKDLEGAKYANVKSAIREAAQENGVI